MKKKLLFIFILLCTISLVGCGTKNNDKKSNNESKDIEEVTKVEATSIDKLPLPNDYKLYGASEAMKQDWYSQIAYIEEEDDDSYYSYYGYVSDTLKYKLPDAIIFQGSRTDNKGNKKYKQYIIKKSDYAPKDGYKFLEGFCNYNRCKEGDNVIWVKYVLNLTDEAAEKYKKYSTASEEDKKQYFASSWDGFESYYYNNDYLMDMYDGMKQSNYNFYMASMQKAGELARIQHYTMYLRAFNTDDEYRMILVYDDLKVNVLVNEIKDGIHYRGEFRYHSDIIDEEAQQAYEDYKKTHHNF